jgi:hypothetical protein
VSAISGATSCTQCGQGSFQALPGHTSCDSCNAGSFTNIAGATACTGCEAGEYQPATGATSCLGCDPGTFSSTQGAATCTTCSTCAPGTFEDAVCSASGDTVCTPCDASCATCSGAGANQCTSCTPPDQLSGGSCISPICGGAPDPACFVAAKAQLQSNEKTAGNESLKLQWKKVGPLTSRALFGDPVTGTTIVALCIFNDGGTLVKALEVARGSQICGTKPCWKLKGKQGFGYQDKPGTADGINKLSYLGGAPTKGQASAQGKNNLKKGFTNLPSGIAAALTGNIVPTIEIRTSEGLCIGAKMNKVTKDAGGKYKAQKK